jgi:NAD(P)-dependent dehydrogenase (short-subunit alcohol dehydrogenase family)
MLNKMKNVLITGASGNIGKAAVEKFIQEGFNVIATASPRGLGYELAGLSVYEADLTNEKSVDDAIAKIISVHQTIDVAILTVGSFAVGSIETTDGAAIQKMMSLNFNTAYFTARPIFKQMMEQQTGRIIFIGSRPALVAAEGKNTVAYALSKSLVFKLAELLNAEAGEKDIVTSVIVPGVIDTPENRKSNPSANFSDWVTPETIVDSMLYLVSPNAKALREPVLKMYSNS